MTTLKKPKIGLALGSGSSRGWAHIGVINALAELGIRPDIISGCSIGSLIGAAYTAGNLEKLEDWVCALTKMETARFFELNFSRSGFINIERFQEFLNEYVCAHDVMIEDLGRPYASVATELATGREHWFEHGHVNNAVWASISIPGLFPAYQFEGKWMVDGGIVNPVPVSLCRAMGADIVIAVNLNGDVLRKQVVKTGDKKSRSNGFIENIRESAREYSSALFPSLKEEKQNEPGILDAIAGSVNIAQDRITRSRMAGDPPDVLLSPRLAHIGLLEFYRGKEGIAEGRNCVQRKLSEINYMLENAI